MKLLKRIILGITFLLIFVFLSTFFIAYFYGDKICNYFINEININSNTKIKIEKVNFDLIHYFPSAAVCFKNVTIKNARGFHLTKKISENYDNFLFAKEASLKLNIISVLRSTYIINGLIIRDGYINFFYNNSDKMNYDFLENNTNKQNSIESKIRNIQLKNININYISNSLSISTRVNNFLFKGEIKKNNIEGKLLCNLQTFNFKNEKNNYQINTPLYLNFKIKYDGLHCIIQKWGTVILDNNKFNLFGNILLVDKYFFTAEIKSEDLNLGNISVFQFIKLPEEFKIINGKIKFHTTLNGEAQNIGSLKMKANLSLSKINFIYKNHKICLVKGDISITKSTTNNQIELINFVGNFYNSNFTFSCTYGFINNLFYNLHSDIDLKFKDLNALQFGNSLKFAAGESQINVQLYKPGELFDKEMRNINLSFLKIICYVKNINIIDLNNKLLINDLCGNIIIINNNAEFKNFTFNFNENNLAFNGSLSNLNKIIYDSIKQINIVGKLYSRNFDFQKVEFFKNNNQKNKVKVTTKINMQIDTLKYGKFITYKDFGIFNYEENLISFDNINSNTCNGQLNNGSFKILINNSLTQIITSFSLKNIDISNLFISFENFGQSVLKSDNIQGNLSAKINGSFYLDSANKIIKDSSKVDADFSISKGRLIDFKPIYALSKFIEVEELNNIKFEQIKNNISLNGNIINIPLMDFNSSAFNISISGKHSLDNNYEYHFKVLLSEFLFKKAVKKKTEIYEYGNIEEDTLGRTNLFIKLKGKDANYTCSYDTKQALKTFSEKTKSEKQVLKGIFIEEFGLFKKDSNIIINKTGKAKITNKYQLKYDDKTLENNETKKENKKATKHSIEWKDQ